MKWLWIGGALLVLVAAAAVWYAFNDPAFVAGLSAIAAAAAWKAIAPEIAKSSPETQARRDEDAKLDRERTITGREREH